MTDAEILAQWADPDTGGRMPPKERAALLRVLRRVEGLDNWGAVRARLLAAKRIGNSTKVAVEVEDLIAALDEVEYQRGELKVRDKALEILRQRVEELEEANARLRTLAEHGSELSWERDCIAAEVAPRVGESVLDAVKRVVYAELHARAADGHWPDVNVGNPQPEKGKR